jgi:hypothetical protein
MQHAFSHLPKAKNYINSFFSSITDKTKSGKFRICFKTESVIKADCYIASVNTKRDWLICSHVALDKCNVSRPGNK